MARTDDEVIGELKKLYAEPFGGKDRARFLIAWADLRSLYGFQKLFESRFAQLAERATERGLYLWDLGDGDNGHLVAVVRVGTVDRWRKIPGRVIKEHKPPVSDAGDAEPEEDDD